MEADTATRLTQQEHLVLCAVGDWKAVWEVCEALYPSGANGSTRHKVKVAMDRLLRRKLVMHGKANDTYKITEAGRQLLAVR